MRYLILDLGIAKKHSLKLYEVYVFSVFSNNPDTIFSVVNFNIKVRFFIDNKKVFEAIIVLYKKGLIDQVKDGYMRLKK